MSNIIELSPKKRGKSLYKSTLENFDNIFFTMTSKDKKELKKKIKEHFKKLGINLVYTSKKADFKSLKKLTPLLLVKEKIGFSYEIDKELQLNNGWTVYPLAPRLLEDLLENINYISKIIQLQEKKNEKFE